LCARVVVVALREKADAARGEERGDPGPARDEADRLERRVFAGFFCRRRAREKKNDEHRAKELHFVHIFACARASGNV
jgi:hypothetical protein